MDINGIGGIGIPGLGAGFPIEAPVSVSGLGAAQAPVDAAALSGIAFGRTEQLVQLINGFSTAEILLALMLASTNSAGRRRTPDAGDVSFGPQLELLLAGQMPNHDSQQMLVTLAEMAAPVTGLVGEQLNIQT